MQGILAREDKPALTLVLAQPIEKGPQSMQELCNDLLRSIDAPAAVLMVGMCGGLKEHGAKENSVIVARQVFNYERSRLKDGKSALTPLSYHCHPTILERLKFWLMSADLGNIMENGLKGLDIIMKDMASGEKLINDLNANERAHILALSDDLVGVEMEGHGFSHTFWEKALQGQAAPTLCHHQGCQRFLRWQYVGEQGGSAEGGNMPGIDRRRGDPEETLTRPA